ncbi:MAG: calcium-binding protein, partial [Pseudomonadota bacterium]
PAYCFEVGKNIAFCIAGLAGSPIKIGFDIASYATSQTGVKVYLDGTAGQAGDAEGDVLSNFEAISGSQYSDMLIGSVADDLLVGNGGSDFLQGGAGFDRLIGGEGFDFAVYTGSDAGVTIDLVTSSASGGHAEGDTLVEIENVIGSAYSDTITGDAFSNIIEGGAGADTLDGGDGFDAISYAESDAGITINLIDNTVSGGHGDDDTISNFESVIATNFDDHITVAPTENTVVLAGDGNDIIRVDDSGTFVPGSVIKIDGGAGIDEADFAALSAGVNVQPLYQTAGFFFGNLWGVSHVNFGSDLYSVWDDVRQGVQVNESNFSTATNDYEVAVDSVEIITATRFDDIIDFDDSTNQQLGDLGFFAQALSGGDGNDTIRTRSGHDYVKGGTGHDYIVGDLGNDEIFGEDGNDVIYGDGSEEVHTFQFGGLFGLGGGVASYQDMVDSYTPYGAHDRLDGGSGNDALHGGFGNDTYVFGRGYGSDVIHDQAFVIVPSPDPKNSVGTQQMVNAGADTVELAAGLDLGDLDFLYERGDLTIRIRGTHDQITIKNFADVNQRVETLRFADTGVSHTIASLDVVARQLAEHNSLLASTYNEHHHSTSLLSSAWGGMEVPRFLEDVNGDGMADLLGIVGQSIYLAYGQIDGTFSTTHTFANTLQPFSAGTFQYLADVDGDGDADLVGFSGGNQ